MILFLTLLYIAVLVIAVKLKFIQLNIWWKLSPVFWSLFLLIALFIPLQFWAPSGPVIVGNYTVSIVPRVTGEVTEVNAIPNVPVLKGDVLFKIDPLPFQAAVDDVKAAMEIAKIRVGQEEELMRKNIGRQLNLDQARAKLTQSEARLIKAEYDLSGAIVRAPTNGYATNIALRPGMRVSSLPLQPAMAFVESDELIVGALILQNHMRFIKKNERVEIAFKMYPGQVFQATVDHIVPARATGFESVSGLPFIPQEINHAPFAVRLKLGDAALALNLPSGATGKAVIYGDKGQFAHIIRSVEIRIEAIMNYINPF